MAEPAAFGRLAALAALQPLTALGSAVPGVVQWKPGAYSPLVRVRGAVACAARLGEIIVVLLEEESGSRSLIGLMLKPRCGLDGLAAAVDATAQAPAARGQLPLKAYRRQQREAAALAAEQPPAEQPESSAGPAAGSAPALRLELDAFVEKSKARFLLRSATAGMATPPPAERVLPVLLHPARVRWGADASAGGMGDWQMCGLEPSVSGALDGGESWLGSLGEPCQLSEAYLAALLCALPSLQLHCSPSAETVSVTAQGGETGRRAGLGRRPPRQTRRRRISRRQPGCVRRCHGRWHHCLRRRCLQGGTHSAAVQPAEAPSDESEEKSLRGICSVGCWDVWGRAAVWWARLPRRCGAEPPCPLPVPPPIWMLRK